MGSTTINDLVLAAYAEAFCYPHAGLHDQLTLDACRLPKSPRQDALLAFLVQVGRLPLGEWEELYTRTWDLDPLTPPYIGFHIWGEDYRRGNFLAVMQHACRAAGVETDGELTDHLTSVLRCMAAGQTPNELAQVFKRALEKMAARLRERDENNPYLGLLNAILEA